MAKITGFILLLLFILVTYVEGSDNIVIIVNKENPLEKISRTELVKIYLGKKTLFDNGSKIIPVDITEKNELKKKFYEIVLGKNIEKIKSYWIKRIFSGRGSPPETFRRIEEVKEFVGDNQGAIGYISESDIIDDSVKALKVVSE